MSSGLDLTLVPPLGEPRPQPVPTAAESTLPNGLRVVVVPRPGVPLIGATVAGGRLEWTDPDFERSG